jgi:uncharacterized protein (TIGR02594 family)
VAFADESPATFFVQQASLHPSSIASKPFNRAARGMTPAGYAGASSLVAEASRWIGATSRQMGVPSRLWCMDGTNVWLRRAGLQPVASRRAIDALHAGRRISQPKVGALAITSRRGGHHVGVVAEVVNGGVILISANHGNRVASAFYSRSRLIAFVDPSQS